MTICEDLELFWMQEFTSLGINYGINELNTITDLNLESNILEMEKVLFGEVEILLDWTNCNY